MSGLHPSSFDYYQRSNQSVLDGAHVPLVRWLVEHVRPAREVVEAHLRGAHDRKHDGHDLPLDCGAAAHIHLEATAGVDEEAADAQGVVCHPVLPYAHDLELLDVLVEGGREERGGGRQRRLLVLELASRLAQLQVGDEQVECVVAAHARHERVSQIGAHLPVQRLVLGGSGGRKTCGWEGGGGEVSGA